MNELSEFIIAHTAQINNNDFAEVYKDANNQLKDSSSVGKLTELFLDAGIKPLEYMKEVPNNYLANSKITSVEIPNNITSIGDYAFRNCTGLTSIAIGKGVTEIGGFAFDNCKSLTSITIPDGVKKIDFCAFDWCTGLKSVKLSNNIKRISSWMFNHCEGLTNITIPDGVKKIGNSAFCKCTSLIDITIPNSVKVISPQVFSDCVKLKDISFTGTKEEWDAISKDNSWNYNTGNHTIHCTDGELKK